MATPITDIGDIVRHLDVDHNWPISGTVDTDFLNREHNRLHEENYATLTHDHRLVRSGRLRNEFPFSYLPTEVDDARKRQMIDRQCTVQNISGTARCPNESVFLVWVGPQAPEGTLLTREPPGETCDACLAPVLRAMKPNQIASVQVIRR